MSAPDALLDDGDPARDPLGVVLRTTPLRESDLLVVLYTDRHGRVTAVARGARKSRRRFAGALSLLVLARYRLGRRPRGELWGLESAEVVREWTQLSSDVVAVAHASYVAELVDGLLPAEAPEPEALGIIVELWDALAAGGPSPAALRAAELALLDLAGHRPAIDRCAACGAAIGEARSRGVGTPTALPVGRGAAPPVGSIGEARSQGKGAPTALPVGRGAAPSAGEGAVFDPRRGGAICRRCAGLSRSTGVRPYEPATRAYLEAVAAAAGPLAARAIDGDPRFAPADRTAARDALVAMVTGLIGKPLRSLEYLAKLGAAGRRTRD